MRQEMLLRLFALPFVFTASVAAQGSHPGDLSLETYAFRTEAGETVDAELGQLAVPQFHADPNGPVVHLAFVRLRATGENPGPPIFYLCGGPGASGIDDARGSLFRTVTALRTIGDVVLIDQRGTGLSSPDLAVHASTGVPLATSVGSDEARDALVQSFRETAERMSAQSVVLSAYNTQESADDLDDLRKSLGAERIRLWAHSYGTHLALALMRQHSETIERAVLGGVNGPDHRWRLPSDSDRLIEKLDTLVQADPKWRGRIASLPAVMRDVLGRLEKEPVRVPVKLNGQEPQTVTVGKWEVQVLTALQLGDIEFLRALPALYASMARGDFSTMAVMAGALKSMEIGPAMRYTMHCASGVSPERRARTEAEAKEAILGNAVNFPFDDTRVCEAWQAGDLGPEFRAPVSSDIPTLLVSATLDGRTPLADAAEVRSSLTNSHTVLLDGLSHGGLFSTCEELTAILLGFFTDQSVEDRVISVAFSFR